MKVENKTHAILLLLVLIALGGIIMYGKDKPVHTSPKEQKMTPPRIKGPTTPPPGYEPTR